MTKKEAILHMLDGGRILSKKDGVYYYWCDKDNQFNGYDTHTYIKYTCGIDNMLTNWEPFFQRVSFASALEHIFNGGKARMVSDKHTIYDAKDELLSNTDYTYFCPVSKAMITSERELL